MTEEELIELIANGVMQVLRDNPWMGAPLEGFVCPCGTRLEMCLVSDCSCCGGEAHGEGN